MTYTVKEVFYTLQGEGANLGRPAVFIRFAGCNLWSGREEDRATATCRFCDTDFVGGTKYASATELVADAVKIWGPHHFGRMVVLTGGEPLLQVDKELLHALKKEEFYTAVETNGTQRLPGVVDWVCVSPKMANEHLLLRGADELKIVYPQKHIKLEDYTTFSAGHFWLSPMAGPDLERNTADAAEYCKAHPEWRLAIQAHKFWNVP